MIELEGVPNSEVRLWRAVIAQAMDDAAMPIRPRKEVTRDGKPRSRAEIENAMSENKRERDRARKWLIANSSDFRDVCAMALLDGDAVRDRALLLQAQGWPERQRRTEKKVAA